MKRGSFRKKTYEEVLMDKRAVKAPQKPEFAHIRRVRGSMTKPIPLKMREELSEDKFMLTCCLASSECRGVIQWHHNLIYASKRVNERGAILPVCEEHHRREASFKKELNKIMYNRMTDAERAKYPKKNWYD